MVEFTSVVCFICLFFLGGGGWLLIQSVYLLLICSDFLFLHSLVLVFFHFFQVIQYVQFFIVFSYANPLYFCDITCNVSFYIYNFIYPIPVSVFVLVSLDKGLPTLYRPGKCPTMLWELDVQLGSLLPLEKL